MEEEGEEEEEEGPTEAPLSVPVKDPEHEKRKNRILCEILFLCKWRSSRVMEIWPHVLLLVLLLSFKPN